jgi:hypothetical protein
MAQNVGVLGAGFAVGIDWSMLPENVRRGNVKFGALDCRAAAD